MQGAGTGRLVVDLDGLDRLAARLVRTGEELAGAGASLDAVVGLPGPLAAAADDFCHSWRRSLQRTGRSAQDAGRQLASAGEAYRRVECAVASCA
jgi:hypothetical protein